VRPYTELWCGCEGGREFLQICYVWAVGGRPGGKRLWAFPMNVEVHIDAERRVVFLKESGLVTFGSCLEILTRLARTPEFHPEFDQIFDYRPVSAMNLSAAEIRELAARSVTHCRGRLAVVVATSEQYGVSRMLAAHRDLGGGADTLVVWKMPEALAWLGLPQDCDPSGVAADGEAMASA
jgi:hypothetical protein